MGRFAWAVAVARARYRTSIEDSGRWAGLDLRPSDIVISTPAKSGTTWMQMICALLVFQTAQLPNPLTTLSPWPDLRLRPVEEVQAQLAGQRHRRFIKTHTPLDGLPSEPGVSYVVVGRDPRDVAVSLYHQRRAFAEASPAGLFGRRRTAHDATARPPAAPGVSEAVLAWVDSEDPPQRNLATLRGLVCHLACAWQRRDEPTVLLVHYRDLLSDLEGQMRRLAGWLGIDVPAQRWPHLVEAATFRRMREHADQLMPTEGLAVLTPKDGATFFRSGSDGSWRQWLTEQDDARYQRRLATMAPPDLVRWLHHGYAEAARA